MKTGRQLKVLAGPTRLRITLGMTQKTFAECIGVSKSLVSMVENGKRNLTMSAWQVVTQMEMTLLAPAPVEEIITVKVATPQPLNSWEQATLHIQQLRLLELKYEYKKLKERFEKLTKASHAVVQLAQTQPEQSRAGRVLDYQGFCLQQQLKSCDHAKRTRKECSISLLEKLIQGAQLPVEIILPHKKALMGEIYLRKLTA